MMCKYCGYEWKARKEKPKNCPRCKTWLDGDWRLENDWKNEN